MDIQPFSPTLGGNVTVAAGTTSAQGTLLFPDRNVCRVVNASTAIAYIRFTDTATEAATVADTPMLGNTVELFSHVPGSRFMSVLLSTGTGNVYVVTGEGQ